MADKIDLVKFASEISKKTGLKDDETIGNTRELIKQVFIAELGWTGEQHQGVLARYKRYLKK
jgi:hypothetical protein